jgi:hypothetical protein
MISNEAMLDRRIKHTDMTFTEAAPILGSRVVGSGHRHNTGVVMVLVLFPVVLFEVLVVEFPEVVGVGGVVVVVVDVVVVVVVVVVDVDDDVDDVVLVVAGEDEVLVVLAGDAWVVIVVVIVVRGDVHSGNSVVAVELAEDDIEVELVGVEVVVAVLFAATDGIVVMNIDKTQNSSIVLILSWFGFCV